MNFSDTMKITGRWAGTLKFFPSEEYARIGIAESVAEFAENEDQVRWLVARVSKLYREWPGILEVRAVFCSKFKPIDVVEVYSEVFIDGIPSEKDRGPAELGAAPALQLTGSCDPVSEDPAMQALVDEIKRAIPKNLPAVKVDTSVRPGEDIVQAVRSIEGWNTAHERHPRYARPVTDAEIAAVLEEQNRGRRHKPGCDCATCVPKEGSYLAQAGS